MLLASLMAAGDDDLFKYLGSLSDDLFYSDDTRRLWEVIDDSGSVNPAVLSDRLGPDGWGLVDDCVLRMGSTTTVRPIIAELSNYRARRRTIEGLTKEIARLSNIREPMTDCAAGLHTISRELCTAIGSSADHGLQAAAELIPEMLEEFKSWYMPDPLSITTGHETVDKWLGRMLKTDLTVLGARASMGKSSLALQMALHNARNGVPVAYFTMEMSKTMSLGRTICTELPFSYHELRSGVIPITRLAESSFQQKIGELSKMPLYFSSIARIPPSRVIDEIERISTKMKPGLIILDHLHLMGADGTHDGEVQRLGSITSDLKSVATDKEIPVVCLAQLNRGNEKEKRAPVLSDLRGSGSIEQDADNVIFLHRPHKDESYENEPAEIIVAKNRNGPTGTADSVFCRPSMKWYAASERQVETRKDEADVW